MIKIFNNETGALLGSVAETDLDHLMGQLEEESAEDTDYYINEDMIDILAEAGASATLLDLLRKAVGEGEGVEIRWVKE